MDKYLKIAQYFLSDVSKENTEISTVESGLINNTFKLKILNQTYIMQRVNLNVFRNPKIIHKNYSRVYMHLVESKYPRHKINFIKSFNGDELLIHENEAWRISHYIEGETHHVCNSLEMAFKAAESLAEFHFHLQDFDVNKLITPLPRFCDFKFRVEEFKKATKFGNQDRRLIGDKLIQEITANLYLIQSYIDLVKYIPNRVIHGDPKLSNFLFDRTNQNVISLIDIDTIMPGTILYDFGDMVRSFSNTLKEDDSMGIECFNKDIYEALFNGYAKIAKEFITDQESKNIPLASMCLALVQSIRFITDYLNGDTYYQVNYENQNFDRANNQFSFFKEIKDYLNLKK